jgi:hypothetical protein
MEDTTVCEHDFQREPMKRVSDTEVKITSRCTKCDETLTGFYPITKDVSPAVRAAFDRWQASESK